MENEILESIKHTKNTINKNVTVEKIFTNIKKRNLAITYENLQHFWIKWLLTIYCMKAGVVYQEHI